MQQKVTRHLYNKLSCLIWTRVLRMKESIPSTSGWDKTTPSLLFISATLLCWPFADCDNTWFHLNPTFFLKSHDRTALWMSEKGSNASTVMLNWESLKHQAEYCEKSLLSSPALVLPCWLMVFFCFFAFLYFRRVNAWPVSHSPPVGSHGNSFIYQHKSKTVEHMSF